MYTPTTLDGFSKIVQTQYYNMQSNYISIISTQRTIMYSIVEFIIIVDEKDSFETIFQSK